MSRTGIIIQARMGSTRLPGKVLRPICGHPMLELLLQRVKACKAVDDIIVATSIAPSDDLIMEFCVNNGVSCFRGSEQNVLRRYLDAASEHRLDTIVRVTADCPLIDPEIIDSLIKKHHSEGNEYTSNVITRTFPRGLDAEVVNRETLFKVEQLAKEPKYFEHVTLYIYNHPDQFEISNLEASGLWRNPALRLTVDTPEDFNLIEGIYQRLYKGIPINSIQVLKMLKDDPELRQVNIKITQKEV